MENIITITDDFDLYKIAYSGQCFRVRRFEDDMYRFVTDEYILYIKKIGNVEYSISCSKDIWNEVWFSYFDLGRNYEKIRRGLSFKNEFVGNAIVAGEGIRILRQDKWEMLVTFIISQRKSIPAIANAIMRMCERFGKLVDTEYESLNLFPTVEDLINVRIDELLDCGLGYRAGYISSAIEKVVTGDLDLEIMANYNDEDLFEKLKEFKGVGNKVADCVCLFGYGRLARVPIDVWIQKAIEQEFEGENLFVECGKVAGVLQQYVFYYQKNREYGGN